MSRINLFIHISYSLLFQSPTFQIKKLVHPQFHILNLSNPLTTLPIASICQLMSNFEINLFFHISYSLPFQSSHNASYCNFMSDFRRIALPHHHATPFLHLQHLNQSQIMKAHSLTISLSQYNMYIFSHIYDLFPVTVSLLIWSR